MLRVEGYTPVGYLSQKEIGGLRARLALLENKWGGKVQNIEKLFAFLSGYRYWGESVWEAEEGNREWLEESLDGISSFSFEELAEDAREEADQLANRFPWDCVLIYMALSDFNEDWAREFFGSNNLVAVDDSKWLWDQTESFHRKAANVSIWEWDREISFWRLGYLLFCWVALNEEFDSDDFKNLGKTERVEFMEAKGRLSFEIAEVLGTMLARKMLSVNDEIELPFIENKVKVGDVMIISGLE